MVIAVQHPRESRPAGAAQGAAQARDPPEVKSSSVLEARGCEPSEESVAETRVRSASLPGKFRFIPSHPA